jgi:hypothetical protein
VAVAVAAAVVVVMVIETGAGVGEVGVVADAPTLLDRDDDRTSSEGLKFIAGISGR